MDKQREAFKEWFKDKFDGDSDAVNAIKAISWQAWQACAQQHEAEIKRLKSDYMKMVEAYERCDSELRAFREQSK